MRMKKTVLLLSVLLILNLVFSACSAQGAEFIAPESNYAMPTVRRVVLTEGSDQMVVGTSKVTVTAPYVQNDRMLVPLRAVSEGLGALVNWDEATNSASISQNGKTVVVTIDSAIATDSLGSSYVLDVPAQLYNGNTTMVPIRFVAEALGYEVSYDDIKQSAYIATRAFTDAPAVLDDATTEQIKALILDKTKMASASVGDKFADSTNASGTYTPTKANWTSGYLVSQNLAAYEISGDTAYLEEAKRVYERLLASIYLPDRTVYVFNLGFTSAMRYFEKYLMGFGDGTLKPLTDAANALAGRQTEAGYLHPWGDPSRPQLPDNYRMLADSMCSLGIFTEAARLTGDASYMERAKKHADLTMDIIVRDDYTTMHTYVFYPGRGNFEQNRQGAYNGSCWARGMSWVIAGMAELYDDTGEARYLDCAKRLIDTYLLKCEPNMIARWDLDYQGETAQEFDTSASAITAYGMLHVYEATGDVFYLECAKRILLVLYNGYSSKDDAAYGAILKHGVANKPSKVGVDVGLIYGDYFYTKLFDGCVKAAK